MLRRFVIGLLVLAVTGGAASAQSAEISPLARAGLDAFAAQGADAAIAVWLENASFDSPATRSTLAQGFARMAEQAGRMVGFDIVRVVPVGRHVQRIYAVLRYERSPAYLFLEQYRPADEWTTLAVEFNANPDRVFPTTLLAP